MNDIILFGIQGSGKGTQAAIIAEKYNMPIFETGGELRKIREEDSDLGREVRAIIDRGDLVPNEIVMDIVTNFIENIAEGTSVIFDGLPRSMEQKESFDQRLTDKGRTALGIYIDVPRDEAIARMKDRGRADDTDAVIEKRLQNYEQETVPVINAYKEQGTLQSVDGMQDIDGVSEQIIATLEKQK